MSGHDEAAETCKNRNEDLLAQLNAGNERVSQLERSNQECESEKVCGVARLTVYMMVTQRSPSGYLATTRLPGYST